MMTRTPLAARILTVAGIAFVALGAAARADAACLVPGTVTVAQRDERTLRVTWTAPPGVPGRVTYRVTRAGRVVGQTTARSMLVRTRPGRFVSLRIGVLEKGATRLSCSVVVKARTQTRPRSGLGAPGNLNVRELTPQMLRLHWSPVRGAFGYRVYRDDAVVTQLQESRLDVPVIAGRSYRLQVAAVDRSGRAGGMSKLVITSTGVSAPQAPTGLTATDGGGGTYTVTWRPSVAGSSPIRGYRLFRDGLVVGQGPETSRLISGLEAGTSYRLEVQAVDSRGEVSSLSAPLGLTLAPPVPTTGHGRAFLLASTDRSFQGLQAHYMQIGRVYPTYYDCAADGAFLGKDDPRITHWAQARRIQVLPRINCQRTAVLHRIFTEPALRQRWIDQIVEVTRVNGYEGVNIDFEAGLASDRAVFSDFVTQLTARMHAEGRIVSLCVSPKINDNSRTHPRSGIFDYPALSAQADELLVMAWGVHWLTSPAGQLSPLTWLQGSAAYAASMPNADRFVMGAAMYGIDWPAGSSATRPGTALEYDDMQALIAAKGAVPQRDPGSGELFFQYTDASGVVHDVRYLDMETIQAKHQAFAAGGIRQTFLWRLGDEDQRIWTLPSVSGL